MEIKTKFNLDEEVWFMHDNRAYRSSIIRIGIIVRPRERCDEPLTVIEVLYTVRVESREKDFKNTLLEEHEIFKTKEELLNSL